MSLTDIECQDIVSQLYKLYSLSGLRKIEERAVISKPEMLKFILASRVTKELCLLSLSKANHFNNIPDEFRKDPEFLLAAIEKHPIIITLIDDALITPAMVLLVAEKEPELLADINIRHIDRSIFTKYMHKCPKLVTLVDHSMLSNQRLLSFVSLNPMYLSYVPRDLINARLAWQVVGANPAWFHLVPHHAQDYSMVVAAIQSDAMLLEYVAYKYRTAKLYKLAASLKPESVRFLTHHKCTEKLLFDLYEIDPLTFHHLNTSLITDALVIRYLGSDDFVVAKYNDLKSNLKTEEVKLHVVGVDPLAITVMPKPSMDLQIMTLDGLLAQGSTEELTHKLLPDYDIITMQTSKSARKVVKED